MKLLQLSLQNLGPFAQEINLDIQDDVTIFTGQNDVGKTFVLRMIEKFCSQAPFQETEVNQAYLAYSDVPWDVSSEVRISSKFKFTEASQASHPLALKFASEGRTVTGTMSPAAKSPKTQWVVPEGESHISTFPSVLFLGSSSERISGTIKLGAPSNPERLLLDLAFGPSMHERWRSLRHEQSKDGFLRDAERRLHEKICNSLGVDFGFRFGFKESLQQAETFLVTLRDAHDVIVDVSSRGAGVQKMLTCLVQALRFHAMGRPSILLLDEPENSLHPNAQHLFRDWLFEIARSPSVQMILATHSPCMLHPMRPETIRLLRRTATDNKVTTTLVKRPGVDGFLLVRQCLGMSPIDSLLYAPIAILVEGRTETEILWRMLSAVSQKNPALEKLVSRLHTMATFVDSHGTQYALRAALLKDQGNKVILFLDGDKRKELERCAFGVKHPDAPIVLLPGNHEFEEMIRPELYFAALSSVYALDSKRVSKEAFDGWSKTKPSSASFTCRVKNWLRAEFGFEEDFDKIATLFAATENLTAEDVNAEPFLKLLEAVEAAWVEIQKASARSFQ